MQRANPQENGRTLAAALACLDLCCVQGRPQMRTDEIAFRRMPIQAKPL